MNHLNTVAAERQDIQALLRGGFSSLRHAQYLLLKVERRADACQWLRDLLNSGLVRSAADLRGRRHAQPLDTVAAVAFSASGLAALGLRPHADWPLPSAFACGMGSALRAEVLREPVGAPAWQWGDVADPGRDPRRPTVHLLLMLFNRDGAWPAGLALPWAHGGWACISRIRGCPAYLQPGPGGEPVKMYEPSGFRDGVSQPKISELGDPDAAASKPAPDDSPESDHQVAAGEFVLGHRNEYGELAYCPDVEGWAAFALAKNLKPARRFGFNGSYLAVRQIQQDAAGFIAAHHGAGPGPSDAELMVGRLRDERGTPLQQRPHAPAGANAFRYRVDDLDGFQCPRGAHVRRANPRDALGEDRAAGLRMSKLHRLLRRGRPYTARAQCPAAQCGTDQQRWLAFDHGARGQAQAPATALPAAPVAAAAVAAVAAPAPCGAGLFFIAINADLERQFEFVQQRWIANPGFGNLDDEVDPIVGGRGHGKFTVPGLPLGRVVQGAHSFTRTVAGGYFFLPGLAALDFIAAGPSR